MRCMMARRLFPLVLLACIVCPALVVSDSEKKPREKPTVGDHAPVIPQKVTAPAVALADAPPPAPKINPPPPVVDDRAARRGDGARGDADESQSADEWRDGAVVRQG